MEIPTIDEEVERVKKFKEGLIAEAGGPDDMMNFLFYVGLPEGADKPTGALAALPDGSLLLEGALEAFREMHGPPVYLVFSADTRFKALKTAKPLDGIEDVSKTVEEQGWERGQLQREFQEGDLSIQEAILVSLAVPGIVQTKILPYHYNDQGQIVWEDLDQWMASHGAEETSDTQMGGLIPDLLKAAFKDA